MIRTLVFLLIVAVVIAAAMWFAQRPGEVTLSWQGWRVDTSVAFLIFCVAVIAAATALVYRFWVALRRAPGRFLASRRASRQQRGYAALTQGMVAVAAGDPEEAMRQARRADALLGEPPLTMLLSAQAAQLNGEDDAARSYFTAMLERPETAFLGLRGLLMQAQREDNPQAALEYAKRAYELRPKTPWVLTTLFDLQVHEGRWRDSAVTMDEALRHNAIGADEARRRRVSVLLGCSLEAEAEGARLDAMSYARKAYSQAPEFLPAVIRLVGMMVADGKKRPAARIIHNAWARTPHPELARIYAAMENGDDPVKRLRRLERLGSFNPDHAESHIALAEAALAAKIWGTARSHLEAAGGETPSARVCRLWAELEEQETGDMTLVRQWLLRAAAGEPDPAWTCADCGAASADWAPLCGKCAALGTLEWRAPARVRGLVLRKPVESAAPAVSGGGTAHKAVPPPADGDAPPRSGAGEDGAPSARPAAHAGDASPLGTGGFRLRG